MSEFGQLIDRGRRFLGRLIPEHPASFESPIKASKGDHQRLYGFTQRHGDRTVDIEVPQLGINKGHMYVSEESLCARTGGSCMDV